MVLNGSKKLQELFNVLRREKDSRAVVIRVTPKRHWAGTNLHPRSSQYRGVSKNGRFWQVSDLKK